MTEEPESELVEHEESQEPDRSSEEVKEPDSGSTKYKGGPIPRVGKTD